MKSELNVGDEVEAFHDFNEFDHRAGRWVTVAKGDRDIIESISSNHHGGLQLNLKKNGRGWCPDPEFLWKKINGLL